MSTIRPPESASESLVGERRHALDVYPRREIVLSRGQGAQVWDERGRAYIDAGGAFGVANVGHCNGAVVQAIAQQAATLISCPGTFYNDTRAELLAALLQLGEGVFDRAFLCNSGTEAVEAALKFARCVTGRTDFVCAKRAFHGRTLGALSATFNPRYRESVGPVVPGFRHVSYNRIESLETALSARTAGVILEVVQGEGGVHLADGDYLRAVQRLCHEQQVLFILDEVQTGFCRTGRMFAYQHHGLEPDMICLAKGMAGGVPMGAVLCGERVQVPRGVHGSTFGGNPLACAASLATIRYLREHRLDEQAQQKGDWLVSELLRRRMPPIREIRHLGLMIGIELKRKVRPVLEALLDEGVIALPAGSTVLRLLPPLTISGEELASVVAAIESALLR